MPKLERSTYEAYGGPIIAIVTVVFTMTWYIRFGLLLILSSIIVDVAWNSSWTIRIRKVSKAIICIFSVAILAAISWHPLHRQYIEESSAALTGELEAPSSSQKYDDSDVVLQIGPEGDGTRFKWTGQKEKPLMAVVGDKVLIKRENGKLLLTTHVRDRSGAIIVDVIENKWTVSSAQNVSWDKNYTRNSLEVEDGRGRIVFQVVFSPDAIRLSGEWWHENGNGGRVMRPYPFDRLKTGPIFVIMTPLYHPDEPTIEPIFRYPSKEHWGEYVEWFKP